MFQQDATILFLENYNSNAQIIINQGGTSSGKTYAILQVLFCMAGENEKQVITVVGQDIPNMRSGAIRDALNIYASSDVLKTLVKVFKITDRMFEFHNGSVIEFKSYKDAQDAKSGKRDYLFINEANGILWEIYTQLALRTRKKVFIDFNPTSAFWAHEKLMGLDHTKLIISDHRHNPFLTDQERKKIESLKKEDLQLWRVYARGLTGKLTGLVFSKWELCDNVPNEASLIAAGLDFGFTNDETGCILVYKYDGGLLIDELFYKTGLTNPDISEKLLENSVTKRTEIIADSAEPKSIEELRRLGWNMVAAKKGPDSITHSIDILKRFNLLVTRQSVNLRKELERYKWKIDRSGKELNQPVDTFNHLIDPLRYVALNKLGSRHSKKIKSWLPGFSLPEYDFAASHLLK